ncbi:MAG: hypothetical protein ACYC7L_13575 [Nitrospirota bacterium]
MNVRERLRFSRYLAAVVVLSAMASGACTVKAIPDRVPMQTDSRQKDLTGVSLVVLNAVRDASPHPILTRTGVDVGFEGDRQAWSRKLSEALAAELARKGAALQANARLKLSVAVTEVTLAQAGEVNRFTVKVRASSSRGWSREYEAAAEAETGVFETVDSMTRRLAGTSLAEVNKVMLNDRDLLSHLATGGTDRLSRSAVYRVGKSDVK